jgi:hypothetical protein
MTPATKEKLLKQLNAWSAQSSKLNGQLSAAGVTVWVSEVSIRWIQPPPILDGRGRVEIGYFAVTPYRIFVEEFYKVGAIRG